MVVRLVILYICLMRTKRHRPGRQLLQTACIAVSQSAR